MKDIFIDNCCVRFINNPSDSINKNGYKELIKWLMDKDSALVLTKKILNEYHQGLRGCTTCAFIIILDNVKKNKRCSNVNEEKIKIEVNKKAIKKKLTSNPKDHFHILSVMYSVRKKAISKDQNFINDIIKLGGEATEDPDFINYS